MIRPLLIFALVVAVSWGFLDFWESPPEAFFKPKATTTTDIPKSSSYMRNTKTRQFNKQGQLEYSLTTSRSDYYSGEKRFNLTKPEIISLQANQIPWHLSADKGQVINNGDKILLTDNVYGWQTLENSAGKRELKTSELQFFPDRQYAETDKKVTLATPKSELSGTGLKMNIAEEAFQLLSHTKGSLDVQ